jgi:Uma2 family endonuclease
MAPVMKVLKPRVGYTDLEQWPDDGRRYELYDGEVFVVPSPIPRHQFVSSNLEHVLRAYAEESGGVVLRAPTDIVFSEYDVVQPDIVFFGAARRNLIDPDKATRHAPDLAVEVLSPGTARNDRDRKMKMFARYRVAEYWIVDPVGLSIEAYKLAATDYELVETIGSDGVLRSTTLSGFEVSARDVFRLPV